MADVNNNLLARVIRYTLIALSVILFFLFVFLVIAYQSLRHERIVNAHEVQLSMLEQHAPLPVSEAGDIRVWMTFDYVNKVFGLPPDYLSKQLQITDPHYPRVSLSGYAKTKNVVAATFLAQVENVVSAYVPPQNNSSTPSSTTK